MEVGLRMLGAVELFLSWLIWPYHFFLSFRKFPHLPSMKSKILTYSANTLAFQIRNKQIKCEVVMAAYIERCREVNPLLNAIVEERFNEALKEAKKVDELLSKNFYSKEELKKQKPFLGVPFTIKESCGFKGLSHSVGCKPRKGMLACSNGESVENMINAGAIPIAITNTPELCLSWETNNLVTGTTCNPYNPFRTAGGSSGGEAALIASCGSVIGIGSDIAGSIRIPAMFCGIYGHKPTPGIVSLAGHYPNSDDMNFSKYLVVGPMTRYAEDLKPMLKILAGEKAQCLQLDEEVNISDVHVYYKEDAGFSLIAIPVESEIKQAQRDAINYLESICGCKIIKANIEELAESVEISASVFLGMEGIPDLLSMSSSKNERPGLYHEIMKSTIGRSEFSLPGLMFMFIHNNNAFIPKSKYTKYLEENERLKKKINKMLGENGILLYPTYPIPAFHHNEYLVRTAGVMYTMIFNTLHLPATHVPMGLNAKGLPIGIQVIAAEGQDRLCLAVAEALEKKFGGWAEPPCQKVLFNE